tara:strand:- start:6231 stop:6812 length:582 start_codon:yes stop_codon:yes gene_type:complete
MISVVALIHVLYSFINKQSFCFTSVSMKKSIRHRFLINSFLYLFLIGLAALTTSCSRNGYDPDKISHRPRIFLDGGAPIPIIDEYDIAGTQLGSFTDIFSPDQKDRIYGVWIGLDRRAAMTLQKETAKHIGRNLNLVVNGTVIGIHPIESTITNGFIPFIFTHRKSEEAVYAFYKKLEVSVRQIQLELQRQRN